MATPPKLDARLKFTPINNGGPGASDTSNPPLIKIHGKTFRVDYVRMEVNGTWYDMTLTDSELSDLAGRAADAYERIMKPNNASKISFNFEKPYYSENFLGRFFDRWKATPPALELKTIEYRTPTDTKPTVVELKAEDKELVKSEIQRIDQITLKVFNNRELLKEIPKKQAPEQATLKTLIQKSIKDAGSANNRCAALSTAKRELELAGKKFKSITDKYKLNEELIGQLAAAKEGPEQIKLLSEALVQKAADIIGSQDDANPFLKSGNDQRVPCFAAVKTALEAHKTANPTFVIPADPKAAVAAYADLIRRPGTMLDLPFFLALGVPFIIIRNDKDNNPIITEMSKNLVVAGSIDTFDLDHPNIVFFNGINHYQALIFENDIQRDAMRKLLKQTFDEDITTLVDVIGREGLTARHIAAYTAYFEDIENRYPKAREKIIEKLETKYHFYEEIETLKTIPAAGFAEAVRRRMHKSILP